MFEEGLSYPARGDQALGRIFIGGLLGVFSFLIIPGIALFGYLIRVLENSARGGEEPPPFEDWGGLIVDGLKGILVAITYSVIPFILLLIAIAFTGAGVAAAGGSAGGLLASIGAIGLVVSFLVLILLYYLIPAALTNMVIEGRVGAAFAFDTLKQPLLSLDYFIAWLLPFAIVFFLYVASFFLLVITLGFGVFVLPFIQFYGQVSVFYMFGRAFGSVVDVDQSSDAEIQDFTTGTT